MHISSELKKKLSYTNQNSNISNDVFKKLVENCFSFLITKTEVHNTASLYNSKPDVVKELYATLLTICAEFGRHNFTQEGAQQFLMDECQFNEIRASIVGNIFFENKLKLQIQLGNIGIHLPHIVDVKWTIDYIVKSNNLYQGEGPIFRVTLLTEACKTETFSKKIEEVKFSCTTQELQALIYKLKDAEKHCHRIGLER